MEVSERWLYLKDVMIGLKTQLEDFKTHLLRTVRPEWHGKDLDVKTFTSGTTNTLVALYLKEKGLAASRDDVVLLRTNGMGSKNMIDRIGELNSMDVLHKHRIGPPIYARLGNGLCYGFLPGREMKREEVKSEGIWQKIVGIMASFHAVEIPEYFQKKKPQVWAKIDQWQDSIPPCYEDSQKQKSFLSIFGSRATLLKEVAWLRSLLATSKSPIAFCHNDARFANFLVDHQEKDSVHLVDYEYAGPNYTAFDIANHFCEYAGVKDVNYDWFPDENYQKTWIRAYLCKSKELQRGSEDKSTAKDLLPSDEEVTEMYQEVTKFTLASHVFWILWALLQTQYSLIDFDYMKYAGLRFKEYKRRKDLL